jgi:hypothetical protein
MIEATGVATLTRSPLLLHRSNKTLRTTPAMAANVTKRLWEIGDIVDVLEAWEANNAKKIVS